MEEFTTKDRIMDAAIVLFSDRGYDNVSMRDIASKVGIKAASIYNHFPSKRDILKSMYGFFASENIRPAPALKELLSLAETAPVALIFRKMEYYHPAPLQEKLNRILLTASHRISLDENSEVFIREHFFKPSLEIIVMLMNRLIELERIEPIDTEVFSRIAMYYSYSVQVFQRTTMKISRQNWRSSLRMLFSIIKPVTKEKGMQYGSNAQ
jgi:AcrR family transcriptional regulator